MGYHTVTEGAKATDHLDMLASQLVKEFRANVMTFRFGNAPTGCDDPGHCQSHSQGRLFKEDIRQYLFEHARVSPVISMQI